MCILCCLNRDIASSVALNLLLPAFAKHHVRVGPTEQVGGPPSSASETLAGAIFALPNRRYPMRFSFP